MFGKIIKHLIFLFFRYHINLLVELKLYIQEELKDNNIDYYDICSNKYTELIEKAFLVIAGGYKDNDKKKGFEKPYLACKLYASVSF